MSFFIYYNDPPAADARGLRRCSSELEAIRYVNHRSKLNDSPLRCYKVIEGVEISLEIVEIPIIQRKGTGTVC